MVHVEEYARIRQAHRQEHLSIRQLARRFRYALSQSGGNTVTDNSADSFTATA